MKRARFFLIAIVLFCGFLMSVGAFSSKKDSILPRDDFPYSFSSEPFIHPKIIKDLSTWISDGGDQVVAINLLDSQRSNRYYGEVQVKEIEGSNPYVYAEEEPDEFGYVSSFGYQYIGMTDSGVHILETTESGGGSGVFPHLMLVTIEEDEGVEFDWDKGVIQSGRKRLLIKKLGAEGLGDRWSGDLRVQGNELFVGKDEGWFSVSGGAGGGWLSEDPRDATLTIDVRP